MYIYSIATYVHILPLLECSRSVVRDVVFVVDTNFLIEFSTFQLVRELIENITVDVAVNSPKTLFGLITIGDIAQLEFNITKHSDLSTLLPAINPGLPYYGGYSSNAAISALSLLISGSIDDGFLHLRNNTSKVAIVITNGFFSSYSSLQSAANSLHAANIYDVYAVGISDRSYSQLQLIASDPSFVFFTSSLTAFTTQQLENNVTEQLCSSE